jgi:hypothetical protein
MKKLAYIHFDLVEGKKARGNLIESYNEIWDILRCYSLDYKLQNRDFSDNDNRILPCSFTMEFHEVPHLKARINKFNQGGSIYLDNGFIARDFRLEEERKSLNVPALIPLDECEKYLQARSKWMIKSFVKRKVDNVIQG